MWFFKIGFLLGGKSFALTSIPQIQEGVAEKVVEEVVLPSEDCEHMLNEIVAETSIRTRLEAERAFMNQRVVDQVYTTAKSVTRPTASTISLSKVSFFQSLIVLTVEDSSSYSEM